MAVRVAAQRARERLADHGVRVLQPGETETEGGCVRERERERERESNK